MPRALCRLTAGIYPAGMRAMLPALLVSLCNGPAYALDCEQLLKSHGFLSHAQYQCNFRKYFGDVPAQARACRQKVGEGRADEFLTAGMKLFDEAGADRGHVKMCAQMLRDFPSSLSR